MLDTNWIPTTLSNYSGFWKIRPTRKYFDDPETPEKYLFLSGNESYSAIGRMFNKPISFSSTEDFILQYEIFTPKILTCSGSYIKLFDRPNFDPSALSNETHHFLVFGPDRCGSYGKIILGFNFINPITGKEEYKIFNKSPNFINEIGKHTFTLIVYANNSFNILYDGYFKGSGNFETDFDWPKAEIPDPSSKKPDDWDERKYLHVSKEQLNPNSPLMIPDPERMNPPSDWLENEPLSIIDPEIPFSSSELTEILNLTGSISEKLEYIKSHFNIDSSRCANLTEYLIEGLVNGFRIKNPKCENVSGCGKYRPPLIANKFNPANSLSSHIPNSNYKGKWIPPMIKNPEYFEPIRPFKVPTLYGIGFEFLFNDPEIGFGTIILSKSKYFTLEHNKEYVKNLELQQSNKKPLSYEL